MVKRSVCFCIALVMAVCVLSSCGGASNDGGGRTDGSWEGVDFGGAEVRFAVSVNQYEECAFPAADIYTMGPDVADSNEVTKEVLLRNARAEEVLNVSILYVERDLTYDKVRDDIRDTVLTHSKVSPDVYNNDMYGLARAMTDGYLWNTKNPGVDGLGRAYVNYFDYTADGWYTDFIRGCTFDQSKYYIFAGDYFIDMLRQAWVVYVNHDAMNEHKGSVKWLDSLDDFYLRVAAGDWDYDMLKKMSDAMRSVGDSGKTEKTDRLIGFLTNGMTDWALTVTTGATIFYLDENGTPTLIENTDTFQKIANAYIDMAGKEDSTRLGVYFEEQPLAAIDIFAGGNVLFCSSLLGEMEAPLLRNTTFARGVVPTPKWNMNQQMEYHTTVHDQTEIGCILKSARAYSAASALMQYLNEDSGSVINAYFEKGLKYKYNDDANSRKMMDIVRESTDEPFSSMIGPLVLQLYDLGNSDRFSWTGPTVQDNGNISSTFASERDAYIYCLNKMNAKFAAFE